MKKMFLIIFITIALIASFITIKQIKKPTVKNIFNIGILQTASHPALDASRDGFIEELKSRMGDTVEFVIQNAQGSIVQAHAIAQRFAINKQLDGFFAIATPAAQAMSAVEKERPIFIAAVTDPNALGLVHPFTNVSGTNDMIDVKATVDMLTQLVPNAKTVGLLFTSGEMNSISLIKQMHLELEALKLVPINFAISNEADIAAIVELACRKSDVILAPTDNLVASTISLIAAIAIKYKKPLIVSDNMLIKFGALAARGVDYRVAGKQTAQIAHKVLLEGKKPHELLIEQVKSEQIFINQSTLNILGLTVPETLKKILVLQR